MFIGIVSLFPEMFRAITDYGVTGRAVKNGLLSVQCWSPRDFTYDRHRTVDDRPYGGGPGMLMMVQPLREAIAAAKTAAGEGAKVIYLSPQGRKLDQTGVCELATNQKMILVCGRYEGIDERVIQTEIDEEWSIGDYVLSGGELPAMTLIDSVARFIPGVLDVRRQQKKTLLPTDCWTARTIPGLRCWKGWRYRRFYCRETMPRYVAGA
ncbi:tRNA (guanine-N(1)-)-methyltransferase [Serratia rubidaea]|uniref:tRNA (guanine-N(1)-)-methyltransferase n=1 Tax=Serratia rubidaea TaxID=61652 RepID=A0A3S4GDF9_SERRU|nr:tRNA (guanine-N(1)-)-methyltransferase [Serratia rubidaea]